MVMSPHAVESILKLKGPSLPTLVGFGWSEWIFWSLEEHDEHHPSDHDDDQPTTPTTYSRRVEDNNQNDWFELELPQNEPKRLRDMINFWIRKPLFVPEASVSCVTRNVFAAEHSSLHHHPTPDDAFPVVQLNLLHHPWEEGRATPTEIFIMCAYPMMIIHGVFYPDSSQGRYSLIMNVTVMTVGMSFVLEASPESWSTEFFILFFLSLPTGEKQLCLHIVVFKRSKDESKWIYILMTYKNLSSEEFVEQFFSCPLHEEWENG